MEYVHFRFALIIKTWNSFYDAGQLTVVLYALDYTYSCHENLIASGDQLLLIDAETLLEEDVLDLVNDASDQPDLIATSRMLKHFQHTILRSWLLRKYPPTRFFRVYSL